MSQSSKTRKWQVSLALSATLLFSVLAPSAVQAAPNVWWNHHISATVTQLDCVNKAMDLLLSEKAGRVTKDEDNVRAWNETTFAVVECIKTGDKLTMMVLVTSHDVKEGSRLYNALNEKMKGLR